MFAALLTVAATVILVQLVIAAYLAGVARTAADEAVRTGSRVTAGIPACELRGIEVVDSLLPGPINTTAAISCTQDGQHLVSTITLLYKSPTPGIPIFTITETGRAVQEP